MVEELPELSEEVDGTELVSDDELELFPDWVAEEFWSLLVGGVGCDGNEESGEEPVCGSETVLSLPEGVSGKGGVTPSVGGVTSVTTLSICEITDSTDEVC